MKKVININFKGRVIPIEEFAYDILNKYVESLRKLFANEEGKDEIINDIEDRIAELFAEVLKKGNTCITETDVNNIINSMGRPEDFDDEELKASAEKENAQSSYQTYSSNEPKRMYRDENNKILGGVCSGIANYLGIDPVIIRVLCVITFGVTFVPYIILWAVIPSSSTQAIGSKRKRLFRDADEKVIAGVCSGLSHYFGISVWIPRLIFVIPFISFVFRLSHFGFWSFPRFFEFSFSPGAVFIYIILWIILPEANTTSEKLEMKGEKVDLNNIKNTIQSDIESFAKKAKKFGETVGKKGEEFGETVTEKAKTFSAEAETTVRKKTKGIGDLIALVAKIFVYFIVGIVLFSVVVALLGLGIVSTGLLPLKQYLISDGWENIFAWGTLILFIWVPVVSIIVFIIRRIAKRNGNNNLIRYTFSSLWALGWVSLICLIASLSKSFKYRNNAKEEVVILQNPTVNKLEIKAKTYKSYYNDNMFDIYPFASFDEDSVVVNNVHIRIVKSNTDSFQVKQVKLSNGKSKLEANELAQNLNYNITQMDSVLLLDKGFAITPKEKFRNQNIILTVAVPVGKKIMIKGGKGYSWNSNITISFFNNNSFNLYDAYDDDEYGWRHNVEYIMTNDGLKKTENNFDNDEDDDRKKKHQPQKEEEFTPAKQTIHVKENYSMNQLLLLQFYI